MLKEKLLVPVLAPILRDRKISLAFGAAGIAQIVLTVLHVGGIECPVMKLFHRPCPGCGLSRACAAFLKGDFDGSLKLHAFAPAFAVLALLFFVSGILPVGPRATLSNRIERIERGSGVVLLALGALFLYWLVRLLYAGPQVISIPGM
jgi:hypothetical protein